VASRRPVRLAACDYHGIHAYFLTICTERRRFVFVSAATGRAARDALLRTAAAYRFAVVAYCFMPDHLHVLVEGLAPDSDFRKFVAMYKQRSGFEHRRMHGQKLWQEGYFERILRSDEGLLPVVAYILGNPVRAALCEVASAYWLLGSDRYPVEALAEAVQIAPAWKPRA
jgi:putative transposase